MVNSTHFANSHILKLPPQHSPTIMFLSNSATTHETSDQSETERYERYLTMQISSSEIRNGG
jgi:hypothetical protein